MERFDNGPTKSTESKEGPVKVLFIDDEGIFLQGLEARLEDRGVVCSECHSLEEAMTAIDTIKPDVLFLDNNLTGDENKNEGLQVADWMKKMYPETVIYTTTGNSSAVEEFRKRGIRSVSKLDVDAIEQLVDDSNSK